MVAWQRFSGKGKGKSKGKGKVKGKGKGNNLSLEERKKRLAELKSRTICQACCARGHWAGDDTCPKNAKNDGTPQPPARVHLAIGGETSGFDFTLAGDDMSLDATALVAHARLDASDTSEGTARCATTAETHRVSFPRRFHRHLSALEGVKNTVVEARTQRLNVSLVWIEGSSPPGVRGRRKTLPCVLMSKLTRGAFPRLWCDTLAKRVKR